jgi:hypothetical protein
MRYNSIVNVSARNANKNEISFNDKSSAYMSGGAAKKKYKKGGAGLYANIHAKRQRIAEGSGEKMRKPGDKGAPEKGIFEKIARG